VETEDESNGYTVYPSVFGTVNPSQVCPPTPLVPGGLTGTGTGSGQPGQVAYPAICYLTPDDIKFSSGAGTSTPVSSDVTHRNLLPSFNLRFDFSPEWLLRFAASKAMSRPDIGLLKNYFNISAVLPTNNLSDPGWVKDAQGNVIGVTPKYTATATNPALKPETAWQFDVSLEHYFGNAGMFSLDLFYKSFQNYIQQGVFNTSVTNNGVTRVVQVSGAANGKGAKIEGLEVAYNRFFDFLPKPLDGFGIQTNFTYLKNKGVPNSNLQTFFPTAGGVNAPATAVDPGSLEGLSKYSFNVVGLYERPNFPLSFRVAYNWRSRYLITAYDCCVNLPVWNAAAGYLDGSIRYNVNNHFELSLEGSNILNTQTKTLQQLTDANSPEHKAILVPNSWFRQDRRFTLGFRFKM
jgi:TonB-dependent receptor